MSSFAIQMSLQDIRLLAVAYPGAFAAVSSLAAVNYHQRYSMPFSSFAYPSTVDQLAALDCTVRHRHRILQEESSGRTARTGSMAASGKVHSSGLVESPAVDRRSMTTLSPLPASDVNSFSFLDSSEHMKISEPLVSSGMVLLF